MSRSDTNRFMAKYVQCIFMLFNLWSPVFSVPAQMDIPTISNLKAFSFDVGFTTVADAVKYHVTVSPKHSSGFLSYTVTESGTTITGLSSSTLYQVSIKGENSTGFVGPDSNLTTIHTHPEPPTIRTSNQFPDSTFIFFYSKNYARVSEWTIQYRKHGSNTTATVTTTTGQYYSYRLSGLSGDTTYEIRARASKLNSSIILAESDVDFSAWQNFTTIPHLIFGRVILDNVTYTISHSTVNSPEWNSSSETISSAYSSIPNNGISLLRIENRGGNPIVHYQMKVKDERLPSTTNYTLTGSGFTRSAINNGGQPVGTPYSFNSAPSDTSVAFGLAYRPLGGSDCRKLINRYMFMTRDDGSTTEISLNVVSAEGAAADESDSLIINDNGVLERDDGELDDSVKPNVVIGLAPKFRIMDCLRDSSDSDSIYSEALVTVAIGTEEPIFPFFITTAPLPNVINSSATTYSSSTDGTSLTLNIPAVDKAVKYEILNGTAPIATLNEADIDGSSSLNLAVDSLQEQTTYSFNIKVTLRQQDGETKDVTSQSPISVNTSSDQCAICDENASCIIQLNGNVECTCNTGFIGNGTTCERVTTTTEEPTPPSSTTQSTTDTSTTSYSTTTIDPTTPLNPTTTPAPTTSVSTTTVISTTTADSTTTIEPTTPLNPTTTPAPTTSVSTTTVNPTTTPNPTTIIDSTTSPIPTTAPAPIITTVNPTTTTDSTTTIESTTSLNPTTTPAPTTTVEPTTITESTTAVDSTTPLNPTTTPAPTTIRPTTVNPTTTAFPTTTFNPTTSIEPTTPLNPTTTPTPVLTTTILTTTVNPTTTTDSTTTIDPTTPLDPTTTPALTTTILTTISNPTTISDSTTISNPTTDLATSLNPTTTPDPTTNVDQTTITDSTTAVDPTTLLNPTTTPAPTTMPPTTVNPTTTAFPTTTFNPTTTMEPTTTINPTTTPPLVPTTTIITTSVNPTTTTDTTTIPDPTTIHDPTTSIDPTTSLNSTTTPPATTTKDATTTPNPTTPLDSTTSLNPITSLATSAPPDPGTAEQTSTSMEPTTSTASEPTTTPECSYESAENTNFAPELSSVTENSIQVSWANATGVTTFSVTWTCLNCTSSDRNMRSTTGQEQNIDGLVAGNHYEVCVTGNLCFNNTFKSATFCATTPTLPSAITNVDMTIGTTSAILSWNRTTGADYFVVEFNILSRRRRRSLRSGRDRVTGNLYTLNGLSPDTSYSFSLSPGNSAGMGAAYTSQFKTSSVTTTVESTPPTTGISTTQTHFDSTTLEQYSTTMTIPGVSTTEFPTAPELSTTPTENPTTTDYTSTIQTETIHVNTTASTSKSIVTTPDVTTTIETTNATTTITFNSTIPPESTTGRSTESTILSSSIPTSHIITSTMGSGPFPKGVPWWFILAMVLTFLILIVCVAVVIHYCRKRSQRRGYA